MDSTTERVSIPATNGAASGILYAVEDATRGVVMGVVMGGGTHGPSAIYPDLAARLAAAGITSFLLDYRRPNRLSECVDDALGAVEMLTQRGISRIVLIGWSFGGAVVITTAARSGAVTGVATIASQTYGTEAVRLLAPKRLLLIHGTRDSVLSDSCSRSLYAQASEPKELVLYEGDGHGIEHHRKQLLDKLFTWSVASLDGKPQTPPARNQQS